MAEIIKLKRISIPKLSMSIPITDQTGKPSAAFVRYFNDILSSLQNSDNQQVDLLDQIVETLRRANLAILTAEEAAEAAAAATAASELAARDGALTTSYTDPTSVLTASANADTTTATITIAGHMRRYTDGRSMAVEGGTIPAAPLNQTLYVIYDDPEQDGGAVSYRTTTDPQMASQTGGRHGVGVVSTTFGTGGGSNPGQGFYPPGVPIYERQPDNNPQP